MTKTILLIRNAAKADFGGAETYQVSLAKTLKGLDYNPIIVTRSNKLLRYANQHKIQTIRGWWWNHQNWSGNMIFLFPLYMLWQIVLILWYILLILKTKAMSVHIQSRDDFIAATIAGKITRRKVVWTDHMDLRYILQNVSSPIRNPVGHLVLWVGSLANHIILISKNERRLVTSHFKNSSFWRKQITLVYNGVEDQYPSPYPKKNQNVFSFCLASRIVKNKGIGEAINAFKILQSRPDLKKKVRLDIYGDGNDLVAFKNMARNAKNIVFHGHQDDAIKKIAQANVYMLPSYQEGFSIALLEATMLGKAIIASNVDSNPEIIHNEETGLIVPVRNPIHLAEAMFRLATDKDLVSSLERNARESYRRNFILEHIVKNDILPLYQR